MATGEVDWAGAADAQVTITAIGSGVYKVLYPPPIRGKFIKSVVVYQVVNKGKGI